MKRLIPAASFAAVVAAVSFCLSPAHAAPSTATVLDCELTVVGMNPDGSFQTTPMECQLVDATTTEAAPSDRPMQALATLATHYTGFNRTGSRLTINGGACNGGWLNLPSGWVDAIASTYSYCNVTHHSSFFQTGNVEIVYAPGGNLTVLAYDAASTTYW